MTQLVKYDEARRALQAASNVDEAKEIRDKAEALQAYARQRGDIEMERWVAEIKLRATVRIGELSRDLETAPHGPGRGKKSLPTDGKPFKAAVLKSAGISTSSAHRAEQLAGYVDELEAYIAKKTDQGKPVSYTEALFVVTANAREAASRDALHKFADAKIDGLQVGDFRELSKQLPDDCAELVFIDPPYDKESIPLFGDAAKEAARILKPGGSFLTYCGQLQLPFVMSSCGEHLRYWWAIAGLDPESRHLMKQHGIWNAWKPILWYVKGTRGDVQTLVHDTVSGARKEKDAHKWQQSEDEAGYYIRELTSPSGLVVDFFAGGGTTLVAAEKQGRKWIGFEIDPIAAGRAATRLNELAQ